MSHALIKQLGEKRQNIWSQTKALLDGAAAENRDLTVEENVRYDAMSADLTSLRQRIDSVEKTEAENRSAEESIARVLGAPSERSAPNSDALRAFLRGEAGRGYDVPIESRDLLSAGSAVVPPGFHNQLWEAMVASSGLLDVVDVINTTSGQAIAFPRVTAYSTVAAVAEAANMVESDPTLSSVSSTVAKQGYLIQISSELLADSAFNLDAYLAKWAGRELGNAVGAGAATVALAAAAAGVTGAAGQTTGFGAQNVAGAGFDNLISLFHSVPAPYRNSPSVAWVMSDPTAATVRRIKTADGVYAWQPSLVAGAPDLILGKPVVIDAGIPVSAVSAKSIVFGDFASIKTRIAGGFRFERSDEFAFNADLSTFRAIVRHGSVSVDANALKSFVHAAV